ncbi:MAG TPA: cation:proton antiporter [Planktothrix sp.]|jgi:Kef-type K+ transport system membrane component KefB
MQGLSEHQLLTSLFALALILLVGRGTAEISRRFGQPEVLGELLGGVLLGPSITGALFPLFYKTLFTESGIGLPLSLFSWTGAILLLMLAGAEVDLRILRYHMKAGGACAAFAIVPSIIIGAIFGANLLKLDLPSAIFLGAVLSVTAVSVVAKVFMESRTFRRDYSQVIMAGGIASEVAVWPMISVLSSVHEGGTWLTGLATIVYAAGFFATMLTAGQKVVDWIMRKISDFSQIIFGQLSVLVVLAIFCACMTQMMGLHALLGPFVFGLLVGRAPRATVRLKENLQALTLSIFAPVFFVTAGMRVDVTKISNPEILSLTIGLFLLAALTKIIGGCIGAKLGGMRNWESLLIGLGLNMRGGSDVVVAILGVEIGLLPNHAYTMYAVMAILTVLVTPPLISWVAAKVPPSEKESERLIKEEAKKRAYLSGVEKALLPSAPEFMPAYCVPTLKSLALAKESQDEIFDIVEFASEHGTEVVQQQLTEVADNPKVGYSKETVPETSAADIASRVIEASNQYDLVMMGSHRPRDSQHFSFGSVQDRVIDNASADVFVVVDGQKLFRRVKRIFVPINGLEHSLAAADVAGYIAHSNDAQVLLFTVVHFSEVGGKGQMGNYRARRAGAKILKEALFRMRRLGISLREQVVVAESANDAIIKELQRGQYDLVVLGAIDRSADSGVFLGKSVQRILTETKTPAGVLVFHAR